METQAPFQSILVGHDGSEGARRAVEMAFLLARCGAARVTLLGVLVPPSAETQAEGYGLEEHDREQVTIRHALEQACQSGREAGLAVESKVVSGEAEHALAQAAQSEEFDLIVVGHREVSGVRRLLEGSTAEDLLRDTGASILVVHQGSAES